MGPMSRMRVWRQERRRIKVWTRGVDRVRGVCTGHMVAFDKHWNMCLTDVDEEFTRKRSRKIPVDEQFSRKMNRKGVRTEANNNKKSIGEEFRMGSSRVRVVKVVGNSEMCHRHVPQVLLRGEHVVMVAASVE